jgi:hypothetical protein
MLLGVDWPGWHKDFWLKTTIAKIDLAFTAVFVGEMALKVVAFGFIYSRDPRQPAYLRSNWNKLDFLSVVVSIVTIATNGNKKVAAFRALRAFRAIRPLRLIARSENLRVVANALVDALPSLPPFSLVFVGAMLVFSIIFVDIFGGKLGYCIDPLHSSGIWHADWLVSDRVVPGYLLGQNDYDECMALPKYNLTRFNTQGVKLTDMPDWGDTYRIHTEFPQWTNPNFGNFNNVAYAMLLLFEIAALEGWPDVMHTLMKVDSSHRYITPFWLGTEQADGALGEHEHVTLPPLGAIFVMIWIVLGCFVLLNMVVGVVLDSFSKKQEENDGLAFMTEDQSEWIRAHKSILEQRPRRQPDPPWQLWRRPFFNLVCSSEFDVGIMCIILLNTAVMCIDVYNPDPDSTYLAEALYDLSAVSNIVFFCFYAFEMLLKWFGIGFRQYFNNPWNDFDFVLVCLTAFDIATTAVNSKVLPFPVALLRVVRLLRVIRILRIFKTAKQLRTIIITVKISLPGLRNIGVLMGLFMYIFSVFFTSFFWASNYTPGNWGETACGLDKTSGNYTCTNTWSTDGGDYPSHGGAPVAYDPALGEMLPQNLPCSAYRRAMHIDEGCTLEETPFYFSNGDSNWGNELNRHANFGSLPISFLTLFRCSTGEEFNLIMHEVFSSEWGDNMLRCCPTCGPIVDETGPVSSCGADPIGSVIPVIFFIFFYILMGYIILNGLFIGVIIENFQNIQTEYKDVTFEGREGFRDVWMRYDTKGSFVVPSHNLLAILQQLPAPLGMAGSNRSHAEMLELLARLDIPDHAGQIHFVETLTALSHNAVCERLTRERQAQRRALGLEEDTTSVEAVQLPVCATTLKLARQMGRLPTLRRLGEPVHSALNNYLVSLLQSRWRGYAMRKLYSDGPAARREHKRAEPPSPAKRWAKDNRIVPA